MTTAPAINYRLPILVTLGATLLLIVAMAVLALVALLDSINQFNDPEGTTLGGGCCGLAALALAVGAIFLLSTLVKAVRDLITPVQRLAGRVTDKHVRQRGFWIIVDTAPPSPPAPLPADEGSRRPSPPAPLPEGEGSAPADAFAPPPPDVADSSFQAGAAGPVVWADAAPSSDFGSALADVDRQTRRSEAALPADDLDAKLSGRTRPPASARVFRVDKPVFQALTMGEPVTVVFSPFLEHVYYVERPGAHTPTILRNTSLI